MANKTIETGWKWMECKTWGGTWLFDKNRPVLTYAGCGSHDCVVSKKNASLIAAAPYMLAALEQCLGQMTGGMDGKWDDLDGVEMARKAISKARGES